MPYLKKAEKKHPRLINRESRLQIYQSTNWLKLRIAKLLQYPLCEICIKDGRVVPATQVHHIVSPFDKLDVGYYAYNMDNLLSICEKCHGTIHGTHTESLLYSKFKDGVLTDEKYLK